METLWSNMSDCGMCQAWSTPTRFKESLNYLNIKYTSPFRFQIRSSVLSLQVAMNFPVAAMPIPITSVRCTCQQNLHLQHIGLPYLGESYCHTKISQSPVSLLCHFVNLWTWNFDFFQILWIRFGKPRCNSALPSGPQKPWSLGSTCIFPDSYRVRYGVRLLHKEAVVKLNVAAERFVLSGREFPAMHKNNMVWGSSMLTWCSKP